MPTDAEIIDQIIGCEFAVRGRGPDRYDCMGVVLYLYNALLRVELPDPFSDRGWSAIERFQTLFQPLPNLSHVRKSDLIHFRGAKGLSDQHLAFVENALWIVTASPEMGVHRAHASDYDRYPEITAYRLREFF